MQVLEIIYYCLVFFAIYIQIFLIATLFEKRKEMFKKSETGILTYFPKITIIMPFWNEGKNIEKTMHSLLALNYPQDKIEIIAVDDGSTDNSLEVVKQFENTPNVKIIHKENGGKFTALNVGIQNSTGDFIACIDADSEVMKDALQKMMPRFADPEVMAVIPAAIVFNPKTFVQLAQKVEYIMAVFFKRALSLIDALHVTPGTLPIYRKEVFEKIGEFRHGHKGEDMEIAFRMHEHGMKTVQVYDAVVYTIPPATVKTLYNQRKRWIYAYLNNVIDYKHMILNKKYKNFAFYTLPAGLVSILSVVYFFWFTFSHLVKFVLDMITKMFATNFTSSLSLALPDWFFLGGKPVLIMAIIAYALVVTSIFVGYKMVEGKVPWSLNFVLFIILYSIIEPIWLMRAIFNTVFKKETKWR